MPLIKSYITQNNGVTTAVVEGVELNDKDSLLLDNGLEVEVDVIPVDPYTITDKQRRKIFALCNDIEQHTGQPREYMRSMFMDYVAFVEGYDGLSLSNCTRTQANQVIEVILDWVFHNDIPLNYKTSDLLKQDKSFLYWSTVNRNCVIRGKPHSDLAHHSAIGRGSNRKKMDHYGYEVLALCREHHQSQHDIGVESFDKLYHLENSWISVDQRLNSMLKGRS